MPLTLRSKDAILDAIISHILAGDIVTDVGRISVIRQLSEGVAATQADLDYDLYVLLRTFYITTAEGIDLDIRGLDHNLARDPGQAASDPVTLTREAVWIDDIALPTPTVFQATLADGSAILYRSLQDAMLAPSGRSISGAAPGTALTSGVNDRLVVNLSTDGPRTLFLGTQSSAAGIASAIQAAVRALTALSPSHQSAYNDFRCDYNVTTSGAYTLRSGDAGPDSSVVVTVAGANDGSAILKLGVTQGGTERVGQDTLDVPVMCDQIGVIGNVGAGQIDTLGGDVPGIFSVANALAFANGRQPASDDAYRQALRTYLLGLGRGTRDSIDRAVAGTLGDDGQHHVFSFQQVSGTSHVSVYVCDGRSLTVGAQSDVIQDVQDELEGRGQEPGGWLPVGTTAGVVSALVIQVPVTVTVTLGPMPDLVLAQNTITNALYDLLFNWPVGVALSYATMTRRIDESVEEMLGVTYTLPTQFVINPPAIIGGGLGQKLMPAALVVLVTRA